MMSAKMLVPICSSTSMMLRSESSSSEVHSSSTSLTSTADDDVNGSSGSMWPMASHSEAMSRPSFGGNGVVIIMSVVMLNWKFVGCDLTARTKWIFYDLICLMRPRCFFNATSVQTHVGST